MIKFCGFYPPTKITHKKFPHIWYLLFLVSLHIAIPKLVITESGHKCSREDVYQGVTLSKWTSPTINQYYTQ